MKYRINKENRLIIKNDFGGKIFITNPSGSFWIKADYDQYGTQIHYEDYTGTKISNSETL